MKDQPVVTTLETPTGAIQLVSRNQFEQLNLSRSPQMPPYLDGSDGLYRNTDPNRPSLIEATNDWQAVRCFLADKAAAGSSHTVRAYERECLRLFLWCRFVARKPFSSLTRDDAQNYQYFLMSPLDAFVLPPSSDKGYTPGAMFIDGKLNPNWRPFRKKRLSEGSIRTALAALKSLSKFLVNADYLTASPFTLGQLAQRDQNATLRVRKRVLRETAKDAVGKVINNMPDKTEKQRLRATRRRFVFDVFYYLGLRMDEAINAKMKQFEIIEGLCWFRTVGKGKKERTVPVPTALLKTLADYRLMMDYETPFPKSDERIPLVARVDGQTAVKDTQVRRLLKALFEEAADWLERNEVDRSDPESITSIESLRKATPHWLRHTYATDLFNAGVDPTNVRDNLGHSSMDTTLIYQHGEDRVRHKETDWLD